MAETTKFGKHIQDWVTQAYDKCVELLQPLIDAVSARVTKMENDGIVRDMRNPVDIAAGDDLNNYNSLEKTGVYKCTYAETAAQILNCPSQHAFVLRVYSSSSVVFQECIMYGVGSKPAKYSRSYYPNEGLWSTWQLDLTYVGTGTITSNRVMVSSTNNAVQPSDITVTELNMLDGASSNLQQQIDALRGQIGDVGDATQFNAANMVLVTDANKAATTSSISTTKLGYLTDVTSNIQTQLDGKCPKTLSAANRVVITDASGNITISTALTDPSKLQYLSGVTSNIQTQLNNKAPSSHTSDTTLHTTATERSTWNAKQDSTLATASAVVVTDSSKKIVASTTITTTELGYLDGVTSNVQTQLNGKAPSSHVGDSTHITSTERTNWNAASTHVSDTTKHITATERSTWNAKSNLYVVEGTYTCNGDQNNTVVYVTHGKSVTPKMVFAYMESYTRGSGGDDEMAATGPVTLFVFATVPMESGTASTTKIALLIPDVTTSSQTKIHWTALF